jgi:plastocyanin
MNASLPLRRLTAGSAAVLVTLAAIAACGSTDNGSGGSSSGGAGPTVTAKDFSFDPSTVPISAGQSVTVTFKNDGNTEHSLTLDNGSGETEAEPGKSATLTVTAPSSGTLTFHCKYHPTQMKGSFTVGGAGGSGGTSSSSSSSSSSSVGY